jgi:hypothetical protein
MAKVHSYTGAPQYPSTESIIHYGVTVPQIAVIIDPTTYTLDVQHSHSVNVFETIEGMNLKGLRKIIRHLAEDIQKFTEVRDQAGTGQTGQFSKEVAQRGIDEDTELLKIARERLDSLQKCCIIL